MDDLMDLVDDAHSVDAIPVVRCKDCVYYEKQHPMRDSANPMRCNHPCLEYDIECYDHWLDVEPDDFCSYGVRKEDAHD